MKISDNGVDFIKQFEGFSPKACKCVSTEKYYTIGYGHYGADVKKNDTITKEKALELLKSDLKGFESKVNKYEPNYKYTQNEFDALVSFCYNVGNIDKLTKNGTRPKKEISQYMILYTKSGGVSLRGLEKRRMKERELFLTPYENNELYYKKYTGTSTNIDMIFKSIGVADKYIGAPSRRKPIAQANGITDYTGSLNDNLTLITLAKVGKLKRA